MFMLKRHFVVSYSTMSLDDVSEVEKTLCMFSVNGTSLDSTPYDRQLELCFFCDVVAVVATV